LVELSKSFNSENVVSILSWAEAHEALRFLFFPPAVVKYFQFSKETKKAHAVKFFGVVFQILEFLFILFRLRNSAVGFIAQHPGQVKKSRAWKKVGEGRGGQGWRRLEGLEARGGWS
jgi:hypothetical protein